MNENLTSADCVWHMVAPNPPSSLASDTRAGSEGKTEGDGLVFRYLRTLRAGARALSLERGSLLDIILRLQDRTDKTGGA